MLGDLLTPFESLNVTGNNPNLLDLGRYYYLGGYSVYDLNYQLLYNVNVEHAVSKCELEVFGSGETKRLVKALNLQWVCIRSGQDEHGHWRYRTIIKQFDNVILLQTGWRMIHVPLSGDFPEPVYEIYIKSGNYLFNFNNDLVYVKSPIRGTRPPGYGT